MTVLAGAFILLLPASALSFGTLDVPAGAIAPAQSPGASGGALATGFTENLGQVANGDVRFYASSRGMQLGFTDSGVLVRLIERTPSSESTPALPAMPVTSESEAPSMTRGVLLRITFEGANIVAPEGRGQLTHRSHFFLGNDPANWRTNVRSYSEVVYPDLYDGIDLVYRISPEGPKYDVIVRPGARLDQVKIRYEGADGIRIEGKDLVLLTPIGRLTDSAPVSEQEGTPAACDFALRGFSVGFSCVWDRDRTLVIDPLVYATFLGGGLNDRAASVAVDASGSAYVTGDTESVDFPATPGAYDTSPNGGFDVFISKLNAPGNGLLYATYLGGSNSENGQSIAVDSSGSAYLTGWTHSPDFPTTPGAYDTTHNGAADAFVAKLNATGDGLIYATFLGGSAGMDDAGYSIAIDSFGRAYVAGYNTAGGFPVTLGAYDESYNGGGDDAFVAKLSADGASVVWATYLGGGGDDGVWSLALDAAGDVFVGGATTSGDFPTTPGAYDTSYNGGWDAIVAKLNAAGNSLVGATFLGGTSNDAYSSSSLLFLAGIDLDAFGDVYMGGVTFSADFPATPGAYDTSLNGTVDAFVAKLSADLASLLWATYLGGGGDEYGSPVALAAGTDPVVAGYTSSADFPVTPGAYDTSLNGTVDTFLATLGADGTSLLRATYLGGSGEEYGFALALDNGTDPVVAGYTTSADFPVTPGAHDTSLNGGADVFVAKLSLNSPPVADAGPNLVTVRNATVALDGSGSSDPESDPLTYNWTQEAGPNILTITNATTSIASVVPTIVGTYTFNITVTDAYGDSSSDLADVIVLNSVPVADAGSDQVAFENVLVTLDGTGSLDPDGDALTYNWTQIAGPLQVTLANPNTTTPSFTTPNGAFASGVYSFSLTVADALGGNDTDMVNVSVSNRPPTASAGADQNVVGQFSTVTLDGSNSSDPDGEPLTFFWWQGAGPGSVTFTAQFAAMTDFTAVGAGVYTFWLFVYDPEITNVSDSVDVTVGNAGPSAALAVTPNPVLVGAPANVNASGSTDSDGTIVQYNFTFGDGTSSGNVTNSAITHAWNASGSYLVNVTVWDDSGSTDTATVVVFAFNDFPPTAFASVTPSATGDLSTMFSFDASNSTDDNGIVAWRWDFGDGTNATTVTVMHSYSSRGTFVVTLTVWDTLNQADTDTLFINVTNRAPIANAGPDQTAPKKTLVTLNASVSSDPDLDTLSFSWSKFSGPAVTLVGANTATPSFSPQVRGTYTFQVNVTDGMGGLSQDTVVVNATNADPVADAGPDQLIPRKGQLVTLNGTGSTDPNGDTLSFAWAQTGGPPVSFNGASTANPTFTPGAPGVYTFHLVVDDLDGGTAGDDVLVDVRNQLPVAALARNPPTALVNQGITFDGGASVDGDGSLVSWTLDFGDATTPASGSGTPPVVTHPYATPGIFVATLAVTDDDGGTDTATASVTIGVDNPPSANAGPDQSGTLATTFTFDASASTDDNGIVAWRWEFGDGTPNATTSTTSHAYARKGTFTVNLTVWDALNQADTDSLTVLVRNRAPIANAGPDQQNVTAGTLVTLDGRGSSDPDGDPLTYIWTRTSGPATVTLTNGNSASPTFTPTVAGTYVFSLVVSDGTNTSAADSMTIVVVEPTVQPRDNTLLFLGPIVAALAVILLLAAALLRRRRKRSEESGEGKREEPRKGRTGERDTKEVPEASELDEDWDDFEM